MCTCSGVEWMNDTTCPGQCGIKITYGTHLPCHRGNYIRSGEVPLDDIVNAANLATLAQKENLPK